MTNPINIKLSEKLRSKEPLTTEDRELLLENEEFLETLLTWLHWNFEKQGFEIGHYGDGVIDNPDTNEYISEYFEKRSIQ